MTRPRERVIECDLGTVGTMSTDLRPTSEKLDPDLSRKRRPDRQHLYRLLFELMPGSVVLMDARGFVLDANPAFCRQIGFSREELLGAHVSRFSQDSVETIERNLTRLMAGEMLEHQVTNVQ